MTTMDDDAAHAEERRRRLIEASDDYLAELLAEVGEPTAEERAEAEHLALSLSRRARPA